MHPPRTSLRFRACRGPQSSRPFISFPGRDARGEEFALLPAMEAGPARPGNIEKYVYQKGPH